jgi:hypothetical protein
VRAALLLTVAWVGCTGQSGVDQLRFACTSTNDCAADFVCVNRVCTRRLDGGTWDPDAGAIACTTAATCPLPVNADAACIAGFCSRGRCRPDYYDLDGPRTFGCEVGCVDQVCVDLTGTVTAINGVPVTDRSGGFATAASGGAFGSHRQFSTGFIHEGVLSDATPAPLDGGVELSGPSHRLVGGIHAAQDP